MPIGPKRLPFFEHIAELRKRLIIVVSVVIVTTLVLYTWAWDVFDFVLKPVLPYLKAAGVDQFKVGGPFEGFTLRFKIAMYAAIVLTSPIIIWQVMAFFLPALKPRERRYVIPTFAAMLLLFIGGVVFCYMVVVPVGFEWMIDQTSNSLVGQLGLADKWFQAVMLMLLAFGIGFQLPVIVFYLMIFNVVPYQKLRQNWRVVVRRHHGRRRDGDAGLVAGDDGRTCRRVGPALRGEHVARAHGAFQAHRRAAAPRSGRGLGGPPKVHEMGITQGILASAFEAADKAGATQITEIRISVGELTEIQDFALQFAFESLTPGTIAEGATLTVNSIPARSHCNSCGADYDHDRFQMICPVCESLNVTPLQGRELRIDSIEAEQPDEVAAGADDRGAEE